MKVSPVMLPHRTEFDGNEVAVIVSGAASPAHPVNTPTSSRPPSAQSECYLSSAQVGSERGSRASSYKSVSPSPSKRSRTPLQAVKFEDTSKRDLAMVLINIVIIRSFCPVVEVVVSHIVNIGEFFVQSPDQQLKMKGLSESLTLQSAPMQLSLNDLKEG